MLRVWLLAASAMIAFAANSVVARLALGGGGIDPGTFTLVRLASGAGALAILVRARAGIESPRRAREGSWRSAGLLLTYAATFSYAYLRLGAGTGALVLFGVVQAVMFTAAIRSGERPGRAGWSGLVLAVVGLVTLVGPGASRPDPVGAVLMAVSGVAWAGYTLRGAQGERPVMVTAENFLRSVPLAIALWLTVLLLVRGTVHVGAAGAGLAVLSGAAASGLGYALWYTVLPWLSHVQSGLVQLAPAPLAAIGALAVLGEPITPRVVLSSLAIVAGVLIGVLHRSHPRREASGPTGGLPLDVPPPEWLSQPEGVSRSHD
jgi:drug/metabolite transporter (DMT)-like permease